MCFFQQWGGVHKIGYNRRPLGRWTQPDSSTLDRWDTTLRVSPAYIPGDQYYHRGKQDAGVFPGAFNNRRSSHLELRSESDVPAG